MNRKEKSILTSKCEGSIPLNNRMVLKTNDYFQQFSYFFMLKINQSYLKLLITKQKNVETVLIHAGIKIVKKVPLSIKGV